MIYFKKVRFTLLVQHDVKAKNLEEQRILEVVHLKRFVGICKMGLP